MRAFVAAWPDDATRERLAALELGRSKNLRLVGPDPLARHAALPRRGGRRRARRAGRGAGAPPPPPSRARRVPARSGDGVVHRGARPAAARRRARRPGRGACGAATRPLVPEPTAGRAALQRPPDAGPGEGPAGRRGPGRAGRHPLRRRASRSTPSTWWPRSPRRPGHVYSTAGPGAARPRGVSQAGRPVRNSVTAWAMAAAAACWKAGVTSSAASVGVAHVAALDEHLGHRRQVEAGQVVAGLQAVDAVVGAHRHRRAGREGVAQRGRRRSPNEAIDAVVRPVGHRLEHGEAAPAGRPAVGVDVDARRRRARR